MRRKWIDDGYFHPRRTRERMGHTVFGAQSDIEIIDTHHVARVALPVRQCYRHLWPGLDTEAAARKEELLLQRGRAVPAGHTLQVAGWGVALAAGTRAVKIRFACLGVAAEKICGLVVVATAEDLALPRSAA